jgi:methyl-accepting chemotaxis protein
MNEISSQINTAAENASKANNLADGASDAAKQSSMQMDEMIVAMDSISESSKNISKIIKVIDEIAFQTNLLALNAAVEAARAGKHGKGFAVVAEEVRNLAHRSSKAAEETTELIESSVEKATRGSNVAQKTSKAMKQVEESIINVSTLIDEIATASKEQAVGVSQINIGLSQIDQVIQQNSATAEDSATVCVKLADQSSDLFSLLQKFALKGSQSRGLIRWTDDLNINIENIDDQHKQLVSLINELFTAMQKNSDQNIIANVVDKLVDYTQYHFKSEEDIQRKYGYPELAAHKRIHVNFVNKVGEVAAQIKSGERIAAADIFAFLKDWLISHIKKQDKEGYGVFIHSQISSMQSKSPKNNNRYDDNWG